MAAIEHSASVMASMLAEPLTLSDVSPTKSVKTTPNGQDKQTFVPELSLAAAKCRLFRFDREKSAWLRVIGRSSNEDTRSTRSRTQPQVAMVLCTEPTQSVAVEDARLTSPSPLGWNRGRGHDARERVNVNPMHMHSKNMNMSANTNTSGRMRHTGSAYRVVVLDVPEIEIEFAKEEGDAHPLPHPHPQPLTLRSLIGIGSEGDGERDAKDAADITFYSYSDLIPAMNCLLQPTSLYRREKKHKVTGAGAGVDKDKTCFHAIVDVCSGDGEGDGCVVWGMEFDSEDVAETFEGTVACIISDLKRIDQEKEKEKEEERERDGQDTEKQKHKSKQKQKQKRSFRRGGEGDGDGEGDGFDISAVSGGLGVESGWVEEEKDKEEEKEKEMPHTHGTPVPVPAAVSDLPRRKRMDTVDESGNTELHEACFFGDEKRVLKLLQNGANSNQRNHRGEIALHIACAEGRKKTVNMLLRTDHDSPSPVEINAKEDVFGNTPLHIAAINGHLKVCQKLVEAGAEVKVRNNEGKTPGDVAKSKKILRYFQDDREW